MKSFGAKFPCLDFMFIVFLWNRSQYAENIFLRYLAVGKRRFTSYF